MIEKGCELMWLEEENGKQFTLIVILSARLPKSRTAGRQSKEGGISSLQQTVSRSLLALKNIQINAYF